MVFPVLSGKMNCFSRKYVFCFNQKMKDDLSQKVYWNMIFPVWSVKMIFNFPVNMMLLFGQNWKMISPPKK